MAEPKDILRYGTPQHNKVRDALRDRQRLSLEQMGKFHTQWDKAENTFRMYLPARTEDKRRKSKRDNSGQPQYTDIVVPYSYAILMAYHMYMSTVFLSRTPIWQFQSRSGDKERTAYSIESLLEYQTHVGEMLAPLFIWLMDVGKYGLSLAGNYWDKRVGRIVEFVDAPNDNSGAVDANRETKRVKQTREITTYEGNRIFNIRPKDFLPDPRVPLARFHEGEFCGYTTVVLWNDIIRNESYFNKDHIPKDLQDISRPAANTTSGEPPLYTTREVKLGRSEITVLVMYVDLIPNLWGLGESSMPEKWVFYLGNGETVIGAEPHGALHDRFPCFINMYEIEGHDFIGRGILELLNPLNDGMTWLLNSHFYNVRKSLNDNFIYDPSRLVSADLEGGPGRAVRLLPSAYGTRIDQAFMQIPVGDVTRSHISDMQTLADLMQRMSGVMDTIMGMLDSGGRKTATEIRGASSFSTNRLKTQAEWNSALGWTPLARCMLSNTQQYMEEPLQVRIAGQQLLKDNSLLVTPESIAGAYDYIPADGTLPVDRSQQAMLWSELMKTAAQLTGPDGRNPIMETYDLGSIFAWVGQLLGLKNMERFRLQPAPDGQIAQEAQKGNLIQIPGGVPGSGTQSQGLRG